MIILLTLYICTGGFKIKFGCSLYKVCNLDVTTNAIYEWSSPVKLALKMNEADILMHLIESLLVQVFP